MKLRIKTPQILLVAGMLLFAQFLCGCDYARMKDDEAVQPYDARLPKMPTESVPLKED